MEKDGERAQDDTQKKVVHIECSTESTAMMMGSFVDPGKQSMLY